MVPKITLIKKRHFVLFCLISLSFYSYSQCPSPNNNFEEFVYPGVGITPATLGVPVEANSIWGGLYVQVNVEAGNSYNFTTVGSEARVAAAYPANPAPQVDFDPIMTLMDNSGTSGSNGAVVAFNDDFSGQIFPELEYTATYTGPLYVQIDPQPGTDIYFTTGGVTTLTNAGADVNCDTYAVDSVSVQVTRIPTLSTPNFGLNLHKVSVYPNPVTDVLNISIKNNANLETVTVYDIQGKEVHNGMLPTIDMTSYNSGVYFVKVTSNKGTSTHKVIKE